MKEEFLELKKDIVSLLHKDNIVSILIYGTALNSDTAANDLDIVIVVKNVDVNLKELFALLAKRYASLDFNVYSQSEILGDLSYYTREFKLEYLSKGLCIYGENILKAEFSKVTLFRYKQSILIRSIEHLQSVRQKYYSTSTPEDKKLLYLKKYFLRISKNILLFNQVFNHSEVNSIDKTEIFKKLVEIEMFEFSPDIDSITKLDDYFSLFHLIDEALIRCKRRFDINKLY